MGSSKMIVGITGHQKRDGIDWNWVGEAIRHQLIDLSATSCLSSLAEGTDQCFAKVARALGIPVTAVVPLDDYERFFSPQGLAEYSTLLQNSGMISLRFAGDPEHAFLNAGRYIVDHCDVLLAVWDGHHAEGLGGTGDIVQYARAQRTKTFHLNPCDESSVLIESRSV